VARTVITQVVEIQKAEHNSVATAVASQVREQATKLLALVTERTSALATMAGLGADVAAAKIKLDELSGTAKSLVEQVAALATNRSGVQLAEVIKELASLLAQRDGVILQSLQD